MALTEHQMLIIKNKKKELKIMNQVSRLEKEISSLEKRLDLKQEKLSTLIKIFDDKKGYQEKKISTQNSKEKGDTDNSLSLL